MSAVSLWLHSGLNLRVTLHEAVSREEGVVQLMALGLAEDEAKRRLDTEVEERAWLGRTGGYSEATRLLTARVAAEALGLEG